MPLGTSVSNVNRELFPTMPAIPFKSEHREKLASYEFTKSELDLIIAMVAWPVNKKKLAENADAQKSLDVEWDKLMNRRPGTWTIPKNGQKSRRKPSGGGCRLWSAHVSSNSITAPVIFGARHPGTDSKRPELVKHPQARVLQMLGESY